MTFSFISFTSEFIVLNSVKTALPISKPLTKYSSEGPKAPGPTHRSSRKIISSGLIPNGPDNNLKSNSMHLSFQYPCFPLKIEC